MKIGDFHDRARLRHSCRVVQSAEKYFFIKNIIFFLGNKNMPRIVSDLERAGTRSPARNRRGLQETAPLHSESLSFSRGTVYSLKQKTIAYILNEKRSGSRAGSLDIPVLINTPTCCIQ